MDIMLKTIFNYGRAALVLGAVSAVIVAAPGVSLGEARAQGQPGQASPDGAAAVPETDRAVQQVAALIDYIAADYPQTVKDGKVAIADEYQEQLDFLANAKKAATELPAPGGNEAYKQVLLTQLDAVAQAMDEKAAGDVVLGRCRAVRQTLKDGFSLRMVPRSAISASSGAALYKQNCATCHGATGHADTPSAQALRPPPVSFHEPERMEQVAPALAFHTLTFGVANTSMASFDQLPARERWNLAFYVVALRHGTPGGESALPDGEANSEAVKRLSDPALLAELSDSELTAELARAGLDAEAQERALAYLRTTAPFSPDAADDEDMFAQARKILNDVTGAAARGDRAEAHRLAIAAYLDGIEPHEASLRVSNGDAVTRIEAAFMRLRQLTGGSGPIDKAGAQAVAAQVQATDTLLAEIGRSQGASKTTGFLAALLIALREGLEVALLIAALLAFLRKSGQGHLTRVVHAGWMLAIPGGLLTFLLVGSLMDGARRELSEGVLTLVAAAILITMTHWVLGAKEAKHWLGFLRKRVEAAGQAGDKEPRVRWLSGQVLALLGLSFFAAYREAVETVLFFRALLLKVGPGAWHEVVLGAALGGAAMIGVVVVFQRVGKRLNPRPVMLASSVLLALLSLSLTGNGLHALQEGGYVGMTPIGSWHGLPALGLYPTWQGVGLQGAVLLLLLVPSLLEWLRAPRSAAPPRSPRSSPAHAQPA